MDDISFDDAPLEQQAPPAGNAPLPPPPSAPAGSAATAAPAVADAPATEGEPGVPGPVSATPTTSGIAYITVADASGRVLFRRAATADEVDEALRSADEAEREGQTAMDRIASERFYDEALEGQPPK